MNPLEGTLYRACMYRYISIFLWLISIETIVGTAKGNGTSFFSSPQADPLERT